MVDHKEWVFFLCQFRTQNDGSVCSWGEHGCISCRAAAMTDGSVLCESCHDSALSEAPAIIQVPEDHKNYKSGTSTVLY